MIIGFTGTRQGMTADQVLVVEGMLKSFAMDSAFLGLEFNHGDCIGADAMAHGLAKNCSYKVRVHPPLSDKYRAFCVGDYTEEPKEFLERNRAIVKRSTMMIATPKGFVEPGGLRGQGTWWTIAYATGHIKPLVIVYPNGEIQYHNMNEGQIPV